MHLYKSYKAKSSPNPRGKMVPAQRAKKRRARTETGGVLTSSGTVAVAENLTRNPFASFWRKCPWPATQSVVFNFSDAVLLTSNATPGLFGGEILFAINGINTPTSISSGIPYGLSSYGNFYNLYRVDSVEVDITFNSTGSIDMFPCALIQSSSDVFSLTGKTIPVTLAYPGTYGQLLPTTGSQSLRIVQRLWPHQLEGVSKAIYDADVNRWSANLTGNPGTVCHGRFATASFSAASATCYALIKLAYHVTLSDRLLSNTEP
jgi:hypothetical protein